MSNWLDGTPVLDSAWYDPSKNPRYTTLNIYTVSKGVKLLQQFFTNSSIEPQPERNMAKNCTAILVGNNIRFLTWLVIPCDKNFESTYICRSIQSQVHVDYSVKLRPRNFTCEDGWLQYGEMTCFIVIHIHIPLRWTDANSTCSYFNSSILSLNPIDWPTFPDYSSQLKRFFRLVYSTKEGREPPGPAMNYNNIMTILFGQALLSNIRRNILPFSVYASLLSELKSVSYFARVKNKCAIVVFSDFAYHFQEKASHIYQQGWGVKYRACSEYIHTNVLICTKKRKRYFQSCSPLEFECVDGTCVLRLYICDGVQDCFDNSDESLQSCSFNSETVHKIRLPLITLIDLYNISSSNSQSRYKSIPLHSICDGIYTNDFVNEKNICTEREQKYINLSAFNEDKIMNLSYSRVDIVKLLYIFREEVEYYRKRIGDHELESQTFLWNQNATSVNPCESNTRCIISEVNCSIGFQQLPLNSLHMYLCLHVECPGMFKCNKYYCLHLSAVCDGQADCMHGDDEKNCSSLTCPGLLKCRGQNTCVSPPERCDDKVNCLHSYDDELFCRECPPGCTCQGYSLVCFNKNTVILQHLGYLLYIKGITLPGIKDELTLLGLRLPSLICLDVSQSSISVVVSSDQFYPYMPNILFANFSSNYLTNIVFLAKPIFQNVTIVDLQMNKLFVVRNVKLKFLRCLILSRNNIFEISINLDSYMPDLQTIEIQNIGLQFFLQKSFQIETLHNNRAVVYVTDSTMCCMMPHNIRCLSSDGNTQCFGLLSVSIGRWLYYVIGIVMLSSSTIIFIKHINMINQVTKKYTILIINQNASDWFCSVYLAALLLVDIADVNTIAWRKSIPCIILNFFIFVSLEVSIILKASCVLTMTLKILFPFKHQCHWLRHTQLLSCLIWTFVSCLFTIIILFNIAKTKRFFSDTFCSPVGCSNYNKVEIMQIFVLLLDSICLLVIFAAEYLSLVTLRHKRPIEGKRISAYRVVLKMGRFAYAEVFFRSYLSAIIISRSFSKEHCSVLIFFVMPINIIITKITQLF